MSVITTHIFSSITALAAQTPMQVLLWTWLPIPIVLLACVYLFVRVRRFTIEARSNRRLEEALRGDEPESTLPPSAKPFIIRLWWLPWVIGIAVMVTMFLVTTISPIFIIIVGVVTLTLGIQLEAYWVDHKRFAIELQLASAIDLMVGSLQAGAGVLNSMDDAAKESPKALRVQLEEVVGRIRLGDEPQSVFQDLMTRVPLETFRLFGTALAVHWKVGGSLAPTLASVGRTVRNRIEITRRTRSMTTQARISIVMVLILTYGIAWMMYSVDHERMNRFLASDLGPYFVLGSVLMQVIGIVWAMSLSRPKF